MYVTSLERQTPNESSPYLIPLLPIELSLSSYLFPLLDCQPILAFEEKDLYLNHDAPLPFAS